jgi:hypothetical protein
MKFEEWWTKYGELTASMVNGNIKQFTKEIWENAQVNNDSKKDKENSIYGGWKA